MDWSLHWFNGILLLLEDKAFLIDPSSNNVFGDVIVVSHAHGDHVAGLKSRGFKLASYYTLKLYEAATNVRVDDSYPLFMDGQRIPLDRLMMEVYNSGHILGSLQFRFEGVSSSLVYTGDINLVDTVITNAGKVLECDELIIDATYGNPKVSFPDRWRVYEDLAGFIDSSIKSGRPPVLKVYSIGKAQEVIALINRFLGLEVVVDSKIARINEVYRSAGVDLTYIPLSSSEGYESFKSLSLPLVTSNAKVYKYARSIGMPGVMATGWASIYRLPNCEASFPLSDHADFQQLVSYVEASGAKRVYPVGAFSRQFSIWLRRNMGLEAKPIVDLA
ncbi:MAG: MBL fold metallo-hydrolase [archaeon YNP-LCB-003-016]|jgi:putative mRNA 3-end processing factor|uniref:MBL fold metallo-hydrolase n=1 Tax=Candidatus Culexarchaeum yellowstonense TaxID=2928963 RepID=UPI0026EC46DE|nr:MBL fold metallo-hydrolase [Candidatus Culexarchaeum yellowstonense]MCR6691643.1 MBL fold metallo-hydrolase [Candidatus Culexarchaeum yellowstonense]